jgi:hypothetical protein
MRRINGSVLDAAFVCPQDIRKALANGGGTLDEAIALIDNAIWVQDKGDIWEKEWKKAFEKWPESAEKRLEEVRSAKEVRITQLKILKLELTTRPLPSFLKTQSGSDSEGMSTPPPSGALGLAPVKWLWGPADLGWLYDALTRKRAIDCGPSAFAALFVNMDGLPVTSDLGNAYKGEGPKRQAMKDIRDAISRHIPENDRK